MSGLCLLSSVLLTVDSSLVESNITRDWKIRRQSVVWPSQCSPVVVLLLLADSDEAKTSTAFLLQ